MTVDKDLLRRLQSDLWEYSNYDRFGRRIMLERRGRVLTADEWATNTEAAVSSSCFCIPGSGPFGFGFSISIYACPPDAPYPGTEGAYRPEHLISVTNHHLDGLFDRSRVWEDAIEPLTHTQANIATARLLGFEIKDKDHYAY